MRIIKFFFFFTFLIVGTIAMCQNNVPDADIIVALDGSGNYTKIQEAIDAVESNSDRQTVIYIKRGLYNSEKLIIPANKKNITFIGESRDETIISYHVHNCGSGMCPAEDAALWSGDNIRTAATLTIHGDGFKAENLTIENTAGPTGQAQAITVRADKVSFINCNLTGYQDTIYFWNDGNRAYFKNCLIAGRTDYIYGGGIAFFDNCEIRSWGGGWITAPSTAQSKKYGFVFYQCDVTYAENSPRAGDDGNKIRFGRPWHNYPKVAWLYCDFTEMINPQGWGDTWNMDYSATSADLHLYEYKNTGPGADMSGRANWAGLRAITDTEALEYTVQKVMGGNDNWDPSAEAPLIQSYLFTPGTDNNWLSPSNWTPEGTPATSEVAVVENNTIIANGGDFLADLNLKENSILQITENSKATYIAVYGAEIQAKNDNTLDGSLSTKDSIVFNIEGNLTLNAKLSGVHRLIKTGGGALILATANDGFSGDIIVKQGTVEAPLSTSLGKGNLYVQAGATLKVSDGNALQPTSKVLVETGATLDLSETITTSEFFIDGQIQAIGSYTATSNPTLIKGSGQVLVGRPGKFTFIGGDNGNWDNPAHFIPALMPEAGEKVYCNVEMETTSTVFEADIILESNGNMRLRGQNHTCTGTLFMQDGTSFKYNTGGSGFTFNVPVMLEGDVKMMMESGNGGGSIMNLGGSFTGDKTVSIINNGKGTYNTGTVLLNGDNSNFTGIWDVATISEKYADENYISVLEGAVENAFGNGTIVAGLHNQVVFSHEKAATGTLNMQLLNEAKAVLYANVKLDELIINDETFADGVYNAQSHPQYFQGSAAFVVGNASIEPPVDSDELIAFPGAEGHARRITGGRGGQIYYVSHLNDDKTIGSLRYGLESLTGPRIIVFKVAGTIRLKSKLGINSNDVTIAGQTAPGEGICLADYPVNVNANNVIIRFIRFRMGDAAEQEGDALGGRFRKNIMIDHCSMSWSTDECVSFYNNETFTMQWCLISESLRNSVHAKGNHGYGGIWGGKNASFHHNLMASHDSRNPRLGEEKGSKFALTDAVDLRNNVIYNWQGNSCYGGEAMNVNIANCYYKPGPATTKTSRIVAIDRLKDAGYPISNIWGKFYIDGNFMAGSGPATNDNWNYGVYNQFHSSQGVVSNEDKAKMRMNAPHPTGEVTNHTAKVAYERVLDYVGASFARDAIDERVINEVRTGTATYMDGGNGSKNGIIDTQSAVGGWIELTTGIAPDDTDEDGMPDDWENANGLNPNDASDTHLKTVDGIYPNVEVYINSLVNDIVAGQIEGGEMINITESPIDTTQNAVQIVDEADFKAYFASAEKTLYINHSSLIRKVKIYSLSGSRIAFEQFNNEFTQLHLPQLKQGIYMVSMEDEKNRVFNKKIVVTQ